MNRRMIILIILLTSVAFTGCLNSEVKKEVKGEDILENQTMLSEPSDNNYDKSIKGAKESEGFFKLAIEYIGLIDNNSLEGIVIDNFIVLRGENIAQEIEKIGVENGDFIYVNYKIDENQNKIAESINKLEIDTGKYQGIIDNEVEIKISGIPDKLSTKKFIVENQVIDQIKEIGVEINENIKFDYYTNENKMECIVNIVIIDNK